ncbi:MAG: hypothetical protein HN356_12715 [Calditrichaeota bacterium]|nr:hypothetical protein [Calditrichota bacterium]MBT7616139.1 hypothetical protein [Calditrichota bacterium]MBT7788661.1 hypothetical protein [Calditrichota bacterium]
MKSLLPLAALTIWLLFSGCAGSRDSSLIGQDSKYSQRAFKTAVNDAKDNHSILLLCQNYSEHAINIDVVRDAQDKWMTLDKKGARDYFYNLYQENPDSAKFVYLHGRLLSCRVERIEIGRQLIDLKPDWPYGYRLVLYCYYTHLFLDNDDQETRNKLKANFPRDEELFLIFDEMYVDRWFNGKMMFYYYLYTDNKIAAKQELEKAFEWNWNWAEDAEKELQSQN